jgi:hypothetical protein
LETVRDESPREEGKKSDIEREREGRTRDKGNQGGDKSLSLQKGGDSRGPELDEFVHLGFSKREYER